MSKISIEQRRDLRGWIGVDFLLLPAEHQKRAVEGFADNIVRNIETLAAPKRSDSMLPVSVSWDYRETAPVFFKQLAVVAPGFPLNVCMQGLDTWFGWL